MLGTLIRPSCSVHAADHKGVHRQIVANSSERGIISDNSHGSCAIFYSDLSPLRMPGQMMYNVMYTGGEI
jgi:hypothetical protein